MRAMEVETERKKRKADTIEGTDTFGSTHKRKNWVGDLERLWGARLGDHQSDKCSKFNEKLIVMSWVASYGP